MRHNKHRTLEPVMHKSALRLELSADPVLNWSVLLVQHIFEAESSIVERCEGEHIRLVDQDKNITHTSIHDITTALFDSYYQRSGKLELTRERKWDDIPKCYYLGFKSGKKLVCYLMIHGQCKFNFTQICVLIFFGSRSARSQFGSGGTRTCLNNGAYFRDASPVGNQSE
jgi:hypothetical protein